MSCGELFVNLGGGGSTPPNGMLQTAAALSSSLQVVKDNLGNSSALQIATEKVAFGGFTGATTGNIIWNANGTLTEYTGWHQSDGEYKIITKNASPIFINIANGLNFANGFSTQGGFNSSGFYVGTSATQNGALTIKGAGSNILSLRDSSNVEKIYFTNAGGMAVSQLIYLGPNNDFIEGSHNSGYTQIQSAQNCQIVTNGFPYRFLTTGIFALGGTTTSFPAIKRSASTIQIRLADDSGYAGFATGIGSALAFQVDRVSSTAAIGFFAASPVNQITTAVAEAAFATGGGGGSIIKTDDTIGGYTMGQVVQALFNYGLLKP